MNMKVSETLEKEWEIACKRLKGGEFFERLASGRLEIKHYKAYLRETYHNAAQNPRSMALFMAHVDTGLRPLEAKFMRHTAMEMGHDELALDDLRTLGEDAEAVRSGRPLPTTEALAGFIVFQIQHRNPFAYLGYLYHLEALPVRMGDGAIGSLAAMGVPAEALSFLREHAEADPVHSRWNREYLDGFVRSGNDLDALLYGMRGSCELHGVMFQGILDDCARSDGNLEAASPAAAQR